MSAVTASVDVGTGPPLVLIPGLQGSWQYLQPAIDALARSFRVLSFALAGERDAGVAFTPEHGLDNYTQQIAAILDQRGLRNAAVCGVSFGGLAAIRFAAAYPERTSALILVSTPGPDWRPRRRHQLYMRFPSLLGPLFLLESPFRLRAELCATFPSVATRSRFAARQFVALVRAPLSPVRMAVRAGLITAVHFSDDCPRVTAPTLIIAGEPGLDRVVPVESTAAHRTLIPGAQFATLDRTGHLGLITRPDRFAAIVHDFVAKSGVGDAVGNVLGAAHGSGERPRGHALA